MKYVQEFLDSRFETLLRPQAQFWIQDAHLRGGIMLLSTSPLFLVKAIGNRLKIPYALGTKYREVDGVFIALEVVLDGDQKLSYLKEYMEQKGVLRDNVTVYSDSIADLPLFEYAAHKVAVFPDRYLKKLAIKRGWTII